MAENASDAEAIPKRIADVYLNESEPLPVPAVSSLSSANEAQDSLGGGMPTCDAKGSVASTNPNAELVAGQRCVPPDTGTDEVRIPESDGCHLITPVAPDPAPPAEGHHLIAPSACDEVMTPTATAEFPACEPARPASDARLRVNTESAGSSDSSVPSGCSSAREEPVVDGGLLIERLEQLYRAHLKLDAGFFLVFALWNLHTYFFELFAVTPYIWLRSPTPSCGKTTAADLLAYGSHDSQFTVNISKAALYHVIDQQHPTLIMDEAEGDLDDREMRSLINAGYRRNGGEVKRWIRGRLHSFSVYCPKVIASIRPIPQTVIDRSIKVELKRLCDDEDVAQFDASIAGEELPAASTNGRRFTEKPSGNCIGRCLTHRFCTLVRPASGNRFSPSLNTSALPVCQNCSKLSFG